MRSPTLLPTAPAGPRPGRRQALAAWVALSGMALAPGARARTVLRYGGDADFDPFESLDAQGRPQGFQVDLMKALGELLELDIRIQLQPWARTEDAFRRGELDVVAMVDTAERRQWARFTHGHATPAMAMYFRQGSAEPQGLAGLKGLRIAVLDSAPMRDTLATTLHHIDGPFLPQPDVATALRLVQQGEVDVALLARAYADRHLATGTVPGVVASRLSLGLQTYALAVAPQATALHARLQQGLLELEHRGRLEALRTRWLSSHQALARGDALAAFLARQQAWTWGLAGASAVALAGLGAWLRQRGLRLAAERGQRQAAEAALARAQALLDRAFVQHPEPMLLLEVGAGVRDANAALGGLLGLAPEALIGQPLALLEQYLEPGALAQLVDSFNADGALEAVPLQLRTAQGVRRDALLSAAPVAIGGVAHVFCLLRDVTDALQQDAALRQAYEAVAADLAQARQALAAAQARQAEAEGRLGEFTRGLAHDLRTPLNAVQGFSGLLQRRLRDGHVQEAQRYAEHIEQAAQRMDRLVQALGRLARVGQVPLQRQVVDMRALAQDTWALLLAAHPGRQVEFSLGPLPAVAADADLAAQVWQNLLGNALKYSARNPAAKVRVDSHRDARGTWYRVTDNGAGYDMAQAQKLFQPFQRLPGSQGFEGTGVGLSLVRRIVDHHGGDVRLRSAPGVGTVAEFTLEPAPGG